MRRLTLEPQACGWSLTVDGVKNTLVYHSGAAAETAARDLAGRLARAGEAAKLLVRLRDGSVAGRFLFPPTMGAADEAAVQRAA